MLYTVHTYNLQGHFPVTEIAEVAHNCDSHKNLTAKSVLAVSRRDTNVGLPYLRPVLTTEMGLSGENYVLIISHQITE